MKHPEWKILFGVATGERTGTGLKKHLLACSDCNRKLSQIMAGVAAGLEHKPEKRSDGCPVYDPETIAAYYEEVMPEFERKAFEKHLMSCPVCLSAWFGLKHDFLKFRLKKKNKISFTAFLEKTGFVLKDIMYPAGLKLDYAAAVRGPKKIKRLPSILKMSYKRKKNKASLTLEHLNDHEVRLGVTSSFGQMISLQKDGIDIYGSVPDRGSDLKTDIRVPQRLKKGTYIVRIGEKEIFSFQIK